MRGGGEAAEQQQLGFCRISGFAVEDGEALDLGRAMGDHGAPSGSRLRVGPSASQRRGSYADLVRTRQEPTLTRHDSLSRARDARPATSYGGPVDGAEAGGERAWPGFGKLDRESRDWVEALRGSGVERSLAVERLHDLLRRAAHAEASRRRHLYPEIGGVELDDICRQAADDAVVAVTAKLDGYRGASRFTTWAYAFAVLEVSVKLRRHAWRGRSIPTADDDATWDRLAGGAGAAQARVESGELLRPCVGPWQRSCPHGSARSSWRSR